MLGFRGFRGLKGFRIWGSGGLEVEGSGCFAKHYGSRA